MIYKRIIDCVSNGSADFRVVKKVGNNSYYRISERLDYDGWKFEFIDDCYVFLKINIDSIVETKSLSTLTIEFGNENCNFPVDIFRIPYLDVFPSDVAVLYDKFLHRQFLFKSKTTMNNGSVKHQIDITNLKSFANSEGKE